MIAPARPFPDIPDEDRLLSMYLFLHPESNWSPPSQEFSIEGWGTIIGENDTQYLCCKTKPHVGAIFHIIQKAEHAAMQDRKMQAATGANRVRSWVRNLALATAVLSTAAIAQTDGCRGHPPKQPDKPAAGAENAADR